MAEAELATIARPYARAAFGFALDNEGGLAKWSRMLALLSAAMEESEFYLYEGSQKRIRTCLREVIGQILSQG